MTDVLARHSVEILDIGQAVIHQQLNLGVLVALPENLDAEYLQRDVTRSLSSMALRVQFLAISADQYQHWVGQQGKPRHIVTLLARKIEAAHIAAVSKVIADHQLNIDKIVRLSGRMPLGGNSQPDKEQPSRACVEFSVRGEPADGEALKAALMALTTSFDVDVAYQEDNIFRRSRRLVVFDMDSTLIDAEVIDELAVEAGVGEQVAAITEAAMRGELDFKQSFERRLGLLAGLDASVLPRVADRLRLNEGAEHLLKTLHQLGYKTAIVSGGFTFFGRYLQERLGVDFVHANELEVVDGKVTGRVAGEVIDGARKASLLREIAGREGIRLEQVIAVGDGANDLPMLSIAGLGIAFRAKPLVKASAKQSISYLGLDSILYLLGYSDKDMQRLDG